MQSTGIIFDLKRYAIHDGPGIRSTVFFKGCPLSCWWCHNPESRKQDPEVHPYHSTKRYIHSAFSEGANVVGKRVTVSAIIEEVEKDIIFFDESGGGVSFSGGEPLMQPVFLNALLQACQDRHIHTVVDTCGHADPEIFDQISDKVDLFLYDLKLMDGDKHLNYTGAGNELINQNLKRLDDQGKKIMIRIPLIPGITDTDDNIGSILDVVSGLHSVVGTSLLPYNKFGEDKYRRLEMPTNMPIPIEQDDDRIHTLRDRFEARGFKVELGG